MSASKKTQAQLLIAMGSLAELWHTPDQRPFATIEVAGVRQTMAIGSMNLAQWLSREFYLKTKNAPSPSAMSGAVDVLGAKALYDGTERSVFMRLARVDQTIYLDLGDPAWSVIGISPNGWHPVANPPVRFYRTAGMEALPFPKSGGCVSELRPLLNVQDDDDFVLAVAWLLASLNPDGPFPIALIQGGQGSAKSTMARTLRGLIDPTNPPVMARPKNEQDLAIRGQNSWILSYDNLSGIPWWLSDACCRMATGGGFVTRKLYSNDEEVRFNICRPQILNGIEDLATRDDLRDRGILFELPVITPNCRISEREHQRRLNEKHPRILGALLDAVSVALREEARTQIKELPRMADFAIWVSAAERGLPWRDGLIYDAYERNRSLALVITLENDPVAGKIISLAESKGEWFGTPTRLYADLTPSLLSSGRGGWPRTASAFSQRLKRLQPGLREVGIEVEWIREPDEKRTRKIRVRAVRAVQEDEKV